MVDSKENYKFDLGVKGLIKDTTATKKSYISLPVSPMKDHKMPLKKGEWLTIL